MRIPGFLLRDTIAVEPYAGQTGAGESFGAATDLKARVEPNRRLVTTLDGEEVVSEAKAWVKPGQTIPPRSRVTWKGRTLTVLADGEMDGAYLELVLGGAGASGNARSGAGGAR